MLCHKVLNLSKIKQITGTQPEPYQIVLKCLAIFKKVANNLQAGEMRSNLQASKYVQNSFKYCKHGGNDEKNSINRNWNGTKPEPEIMSIHNV